MIDNCCAILLIIKLLEMSIKSMKIFKVCSTNRARERHDLKNDLMVTETIAGLYMAPSYLFNET